MARAFDDLQRPMSSHENAERSKAAVSNAGQLWLWAVVLPAVTLFAQSMCVWPAPRFLGDVALILLSVSLATLFLLLAAIVGSIYFSATSLLYCRRRGEFLRRASLALGCLCFIVLSILAIGAANALRHRAFVRGSRAGDRIARALGRYRSDHGEYPDRLGQLIPGYLNEIPYTGMIAYPEFSYRKNYNDIEKKPGSYELRINCTSGGINFDRFIYWPSETYPDRIQDNGVERIRHWAYVHE